MTLGISARLRAFWPRPLAISPTERLRGTIGGGIGLLCVAGISLWLGQIMHLSPWLMAPIGASTVAVFAAPASPFSHPWAVAGGNTISALMGLLAGSLVSDTPFAAALAVALAIAAMSSLRCLHPSGGGVALVVVLTHVTTPLFAVFPVCINSLLLVTAGVAWHAATGHTYPHVAAGISDPMFDDEDFAAALAAEPEWMDIDRGDLRRLCEAAAHNARERQNRE